MTTKKIANLLTIAIVAVASVLGGVAQATTWHYNFDYTVHNRTDLVGPAGGAGETWNQSMQGVHATAAGFWDSSILDSAGNTTGVGWTFLRTDSGTVYRWAGVGNLSMLAGGLFYGGSNPSILDITGLDTTKVYDLYLASYASYGAGDHKGSHSTTNTATTPNPQAYVNSGDLSTWVLHDNYVLFEGVVPDGTGSLTINTVSGSAYGFWSGFQLVEKAAPTLLITSFTAIGGGGWELTLEGEPDSPYKLVEATDLDFANPDQDPIPLTGATVGTLSGDRFTTSSNGDATVQFNLGNTNDATFLRAKSSPESDGSELDLLSAIRAGYSRKVVIIGTSLSTVKYGNWPSLLEPWLKSEAPDPSKVTVVNLAISGSSSQTGGINQLANIKAQNPDTVFMEFSMNDAYTPYNMSLAQSTTNHNFIIDDLHAYNPDVEIIIQTMNNPNPSGEPRPAIAAYYQVARDVATSQGLLLIDHYPNWLDLYNTDPTTWDTYVDGGIHPTNTGYDNILMPELQQVLEAEASAP